MVVVDAQPASPAKVTHALLDRLAQRVAVDEGRGKRPDAAADILQRFTRQGVGALEAGASARRVTLPAALRRLELHRNGGEPLGDRVMELARQPVALGQ